MAELTIRPNAAGDEANMSPHGDTNNWECVDEASKDDDTTYVDSTSYDNWQRDLYNLEDHTTESGTINSVTVYAYAKRYDTSDKIKLAVKSGSTVGEGSEETLTGSYDPYSKEWTTNPDTSAAWTWSEIDSMQAGGSMFKAWVVGNPHMTQVYVVVDYTPGWSNIAKVNGVTATDLSKVRGIAVEDIAKRRGVAV